MAPPTLRPPWPGLRVRVEEGSSGGTPARQPFYQAIFHVSLLPSPPPPTSSLSSPFWLTPLAQSKTSEGPSPPHAGRPADRGPYPSSPGGYWHAWRRAH